MNSFFKPKRWSAKAIADRLLGLALAIGKAIAIALADRLLGNRLLGFWVKIGRKIAQNPKDGCPKDGQL